MFEGATKFWITVFVVGFLFCLAVFRGCQIPDWRTNSAQTERPSGPSARVPSGHQSTVSFVAGDARSQEALEQRVASLEARLPQELNRLTGELGEKMIDRDETVRALVKISQEVEALRGETDRLATAADDIRVRQDQLEAELDARWAQVEALESDLGEIGAEIEALREQSAYLTQIAHWSLTLAITGILFFVLTFIMLITTMIGVRRAQHNEV